VIKLKFAMVKMMIAQKMKPELVKFADLAAVHVVLMPNVSRIVMIVLTMLLNQKELNAEKMVKVIVVKNSVLVNLVIVHHASRNQSQSLLKSHHTSLLTSLITSLHTSLTTSLTTSPTTDLITTSHHTWEGKEEEVTRIVVTSPSDE